LKTVENETFPLNWYIWFSF